MACNEVRRKVVPGVLRVRVGAQLAVGPAVNKGAVENKPVKQGWAVAKYNTGELRTGCRLYQPS